jgi:bloom syndrome protein
VYLLPIVTCISSESALHTLSQVSKCQWQRQHAIPSVQVACRPDYRQIGALRSKFPGVPVTALTATATAEVRTDILRNLKMAEATTAVFKTSFFRPNLFIRFCVKAARGGSEDTLVEYLRKLDPKSAAIVYCSSRKGCEEMARGLAEAGLRAAAYHAGLAPKKRHAAQAEWQAGARQPWPVHSQTIHCAFRRGTCPCTGCDAARMAALLTAPWT